MPTRKGRKVLVTPFGKPAAQMVPPPPATRDDGWLGWIRGRTTIVGDIVALDPLFDGRHRDVAHYDSRRCARTHRAGTVRRGGRPRARAAAWRGPQAVDGARPEFGAGLGAVGGSGDPRGSDGTVAGTCSSEARLATELQAQGHAVSERTVNRLLQETGHHHGDHRQRQPSDDVSLECAGAELPLHRAVPSLRSSSA